ncbi:MULTISPECIES: BTAD domain-containing putative transcriptional regulator [unclassified Nocardioides]|uniref:BTAD domain-containing putative transcriptional regulator n=1 Tax=unclassified Nocardioides TaxID=2615069 RepID=UPI0036181265
MPQDSRAGGLYASLHLLGRWQLVADGKDVELGHREQRLAALLGLVGQSGRPHVAGILWPESTDARALASLRRAVLQTRNRSPGLLRADRLSVGLDAGVEVDVDEVRRAAAATEGAMAEGEAAALLVQLVGEELLPGWYDDWVLPERERLEQLRVKALQRIARHALEARDLALTIDAARAATDIDPFLESASELAIRAHLDRGDPGSALREFDRYRDAVRDELNAPPSRTIQELVEPLLAVDGAAAPLRRPATPPRIRVSLPARAPVPRRSRIVVPEQRGASPEVAAATPPERSKSVPVPPHEPQESTGTRGAVVRLLAVAALVLAAALAVVGVGPDRDGDAGAPGDATHVPMRVLPADGVVQAGQMVVRPVAAAGRAAFLVRATQRPARVRLEVRGRAGTNVVRSLLVRSPQGRRLELNGLDPGTYRWLATSPVASAVSGRLRIPDPPLADDPDVALEAAAPPPTATGSTEPALPPPSPSQSAAQQPSTTGQPGPSHTPEPRPTHDPSPTGQPNDPGAEPPTLVG